MKRSSVSRTDPSSKDELWLHYNWKWILQRRQIWTCWMLRSSDQFYFNHNLTHKNGLILWTCPVPVRSLQHSWSRICLTLSLWRFTLWRLYSSLHYVDKQHQTPQAERHSGDAFASCVGLFKADFNLQTSTTGRTLTPPPRNTWRNISQHL